MIVYLLAILDTITAFVIMFHVFFGWFSPATVFYHALYVFLKGLLFAKSDFASKIDVVVGLYIFILLAGFSHNILTIIAIVWLAQKSFISLWRPAASVFT